MRSFANKVSIISVKLTTNRIIPRGDNKEIDITGLTQQINIFENINQPFLTGAMTIFDDHDLFNLLDISGTEKIIFTFSSEKNAQSVGKIITKTFIVNSVSSEKSNDATSLLYVELIEDHGYLDGLINFSKSYTGTGESIVEKILQDKLEKTLFPSPKDPSAQPSFKYIVPYLSPLQAASMITKKMTTIDGYPFFLYSTLFSDQLVLKDFKSMINSSPFNKSNPFQYSQAINSSPHPLDQLYNLDTFTHTTNEDTLSMAQVGAVGTELKHISATTLEEYNTRMIIPNELARADINNLDEKSPLVDGRFTPGEEDGQSLFSFTSNVFNSLEMDTYRDASNYSQNGPLEQARLRAIRQGVLSFMAKNTYVMTGPGMIFTSGNMSTSVGNQAVINVQRNEFAQKNSGSSNNIDEKRSGNFVMIARKYMFDILEETVGFTMDCTRIFNNKRAS